ncbi:hypothetical protein [Cryptosporangium minutisporangium]|uniref:Uncharacterized protein n=1 Tax=Cryptosporangium minutisporangium TaxID=113569 RepID=A0ABP6T4S6_9ACTN
MTTIRSFWDAIRPVTRQQRFLWWAGTALVLSGVVHTGIAVADGPWAGAVSWRKPAVFGTSFGMLLWSVAWVLRQLPDRRWGWVPTGIIGVTSVIEVALITVQRWRGVPSHFNAATPTDEAIWDVMAQSVFLLVAGLVVLLVWALFGFRGRPAARVAVLVGLLLVLAGGAIGGSMAGVGEDVVDATGHVPEELLFGAAGSAKLAHALGIHGLQVLGLLAVGLELGGRRGRVAALAGAAGYTALFAAVTVTAYAGEPWISPTPAIGLLGGVGAALFVVVAALVLRGLRARAGAPGTAEARGGAETRSSAVMR